MDQRPLHLDKAVGIYSIISLDCLNSKCFRFKKIIFLFLFLIIFLLSYLFPLLSLTLFKSNLNLFPTTLSFFPFCLLDYLIFPNY